MPTTSPSVAAEVTSLSANESASITPSATSDASTDSRATEVTTNSEEKTENSDSNTVTAAQDWVQVDDVEFSYQWDEATGSLEITPSDPLATTAQLLEAISQITTFEQVRQLTVPVQQELKTEGASLAQLTNLEELNMPDVLSVGDLTLNGSTGGFQHLKKIQMDKVTTLGNYNVAALPALENIKYSRLEEVGKGCFSDLANFVGDSYGFILSRTTRIGDECFNNLPKIKVVVLPMLVQAGANSFCQLANLEILAFSDLQSVGSQSFNDLPKLKLVELRGWYERPERPIFDV